MAFFALVVSLRHNVLSPRYNWTRSWCFFFFCLCFVLCREEYSILYEHVIKSTFIPQRYFLHHIYYETGLAGAAFGSRLPPWLARETSTQTLWKLWGECHSAGLPLSFCTSWKRFRKFMEKTELRVGISTGVSKSLHHYRKSLDLICKISLA